MIKEMWRTVFAEFFLTMTGRPLERVKVEKEPRFSFAKSERPDAPNEEPAAAKGKPAAGAEAGAAADGGRQRGSRRRRRAALRR